MKWSEFYKTAALLAILLTISTSCMDEDPIVPDYVGTWTAVEPISLAGKITPILDIMTFTQTTFFDALQIELPEGVVIENAIHQDGWTDYIGVKGSISVNGNGINRIITEIGIYSFNSETGLPTGEWMIYKEDHTEFNLLLLDWGLTKTIESQYIILGHQLTLKTDLNMDGDYEDEYEIIVYKKET